MKELLKEFKQAQGLPHNLSDLHYKIAHMYGLVADEYETKIPEMAAERKRLMANAKSIAAAEQEYSIGLLGIYEKKCRLRLKSLEKLMSAIKMRIEVLTKEAQNLF